MGGQRKWQSKDQLKFSNGLELPCEGIYGSSSALLTQEFRDEEGENLEVSDDIEIWRSHRIEMHDRGCFFLGYDWFSLNLEFWWTPYTSSNIFLIHFSKHDVIIHQSSRIRSKLRSYCSSWMETSENKIFLCELGDTDRRHGFDLKWWTGFWKRGVVVLRLNWGLIDSWILEM